MEVHAAYYSNNNEQRTAQREEALSYLFSIFVTVNFSFLGSFYQAASST